MVTIRLVAAIVLLAGRGLAAFRDMITLTVETTGGNEYHSTPLHKRG